MKYENIIKDIESGVFHPIYFLCGEESYFIDSVSQLIIQKAIPKEHKDFNETIVYAQDVSVAEVVNSCSRFPMFAEKQLVVVREAQQWRKLDDLEKYINKPLPTTILVICYKYKKPDKRTSVGQLLSKKTIYLETKKLYDNQLPAFIKSICNILNLKISPKSTALLIEHMGSNLSAIDNELRKLSANLTAGAEITPDDIEKYVGISKEYNAFELQKAIGQRDALKTYSILRYFKQNPNAGLLVFIIPTLYSLFSKLLILHQHHRANKNELTRLMGVNPYFMNDYYTAAKKYPLPAVKNAIHVLNEYDAKNKGMGNSSLSDYELMMEMTFKIMK